MHKSEFKMTPERRARFHLWLIMSGNTDLLLFLLLSQLEQEIIRRHKIAYTKNLQPHPTKIGHTLRVRKMPRCNKPETRPTAE